MVADAPGEVGRLLDFLGHPIDAEELVARAMTGQDVVGLGDWKTYRKAAITRDSIERWRQLSEPTLARLAPIVEGVAQHFDYEPIHMAVMADDEGTRRQHQIRMLVAKLKGQITKSDPNI